MSKKNPSQNTSPWYYLLLLILAGEAIFVLPFVLPRVFRPTVLEVFAIDNVQLGLCFSAYGIVAMISYLLGGPLADRYSPARLIAISLWLTAAGGVILSTYPSLLVLQGLYAFWGFSTIFLFWAPMIKATRLWGGEERSLRAFGFLDGGRGLVAALVGVFAVQIYSTFIPEVEGLSLVENQRAFRPVVISSSIFTALIGVLVWFFLDRKSQKSESIDKIRLSYIASTLRLRSVWLLMVIVLCAYFGYKVTDIISLYASDVMLYDQIDSAHVGTFLLFMRPLVGISMGFWIRTGQGSIWLLIGFLLSLLGAALFASGLISSASIILFFVSTILLATGVYALRVLYFAVMGEGKIPLALTGTAVGLISLVGYLPDIFAGPVMGYYLDRFPGELGHRYVFLIMLLFSGVGAISSLIYMNFTRRDDS